MKDTNKLKQAEEYVKKNIINELVWVHTQAVRKVASKIADAEGGNKKIVDLGVLFHDIARGKVENSKTQHSLKGAETTRNVLMEIGFDKEMVEKVVHCVEAHSTPWSKIGPMPETIEEMVVFDADMVQQISPFGIIKHIIEKSDKKFNNILEEVSNQLIIKIPSLVFTATAKKMIKDRLPYVKDFFARAGD